MGTGMSAWGTSWGESWAASWDRAPTVVTFDPRRMAFVPLNLRELRVPLNLRELRVPPDGRELQA